MNDNNGLFSTTGILVYVLTNYNYKQDILTIRKNIASYFLKQSIRRDVGNW